MEGKESGCGKDGKNFFLRIAGLQTEHARTSRKSRIRKEKRSKSFSKRKQQKQRKNCSVPTPVRCSGLSEVIVCKIVSGFECGLFRNPGGVRKDMYSIK